MSTRAHWLIRFGGWLSFVCTLILGVIVYVTFDTLPPFATSDSVTTVTKQQGANMLVESRGFVGDGTQELTIFRTLSRQGSADHVTALEGGVIINQKDDYVVLRAITLPPYITGAWCSKAVVYWRPTLSLKHHSFTLPDLCFEVPHD
jgi:hypothetical protein